MSHVDQTNAVRNNQGYWVGIWNSREIAESIRAKGIHGERVVTLAVIDED